MPTTFSQRTAMAAAIAACFPASALAAGVARVDFATGNVSAVAPNGQSRQLRRGSEIDVGETVSTQQGRAQLRFADGAYMSLQPQTEFKVEEFKYSGKADASDNVVMNLLKGGMRTITGLIGRSNRNNYRLKTEVATIGIRGTEYTVKYTNSIEVFVADGAVSVDNQSGSFTVPAGTGVMVSNQNTPPQQTENKPVLPPESPAEQAQEEQQQQVADPVNPIQEASPAVPTAGLVGTFLGGRAIVHPSVGLGSGPSNAITMDASGGLSSINVSGTLLQINTAQNDGVVNTDGVIAWGRWVGGAALVGASSYDLSSTGPLHWVVGTAAPNQPTSGTGTYTMLGATTPSFNGAITSASLVSSTLQVNFGTSSGSFHGQWILNGTTIGTSTSGILFSLSGATLSASPGSLVPSGPFTGSSSVSIAGFLAGDGASRAGMAYHIQTSNPSPAGNVFGAVAYTKQ
jgi:hypothetical protein